MRLAKASAILARHGSKQKLTLLESMPPRPIEKFWWLAGGTAEAVP
jgi:hypothetical protein